MSSPKTQTGPLYPPTITPPPAPLGLLSFACNFVQNPIRAIPKPVYEQGIVSTRVGPVSYTWITDPELIEQLLIKNAGDFEKTSLERRVFKPSLGDGVLTSEDELWRWQRRTMAPLFRHSEILSYVEPMSQAAEAQVFKWRNCGSNSRQKIDHDMTEVTYRVIAQTMLGISEDETAHTIKTASQSLLSALPWEMAHAILRLPRWLPHPGTWRIRRAASQMRAAVQTIIDHRRVDQQQQNETRNDLLDRLLAARDPETGKPMSDRQLTNNLLTLLAAGHETTAKALTWTLYLLARAPHWQREVRSEVGNIAGKGSITAEHIDKLAVTQRVIKEAMRLYPPAPVVARTPRNPIQIGGHYFEPGAQIAVPIYCLHRHRGLWSNPDRFDPDRFLPERERTYPRTQYMPFGAGPRICIGQAFALVEATVLLATFIRTIEFHWDGKHKPEPISRVTLTPKGGMPLVVNPID